MMHYGDHHIFTIDDWKDIQKRFHSIQAARKMILTTEKDAMRFFEIRAGINATAFLRNTYPTRFFI